MNLKILLMILRIYLENNKITIGAVILFYLWFLPFVYFIFEAWSLLLQIGLVVSLVLLGHMIYNCFVMRKYLNKFIEELEKETNIKLK
ncbi:MAG: hypothetical protein QW228_03510 [Candidatus Aenigmatarchaeota archaeon]